MSGDVHVRFCESLGVRFPGATHLQDLARAIQNHQPLKYSYDYELLLQETLLRACGEKV